MSKKIIGITVGTPLPKPNFDQTDPSKGDYIRGSRSFLHPDETLSKSGSPADAKAVGDALAEKQPVGDYALQSDVSALEGLVGDTAVATQISNAVEAIEALPTVTSSDAGKFLRVSSTGKWSAEDIPYAEEAMF